MNAYELADWLDRRREAYEPNGWASDMLRQQADRIERLEAEAKSKNNYLEQHCQKIDQQADRIAELEKECAWAKDQWNKDRICFESRRNELEKDLALKTRDRDVFRDFTLAYEERIEELEKLEQDFIRVIKQTNPNNPQTKPLSKPEECKDGCPELQVCDYCQQTKPLSDSELIVFLMDDIDKASQWLVEGQTHMAIGVLGQCHAEIRKHLGKKSKPLSDEEIPILTILQSAHSVRLGDAIYESDAEYEKLKKIVVAAVKWTQERILGK